MNGGIPRPEPARDPRKGARAYDAWFEAGWGRHAFAVEAAAILGATGPLEGLRALDAGCGTGRFGALLEEGGARVVGLDADPGMLAVAAERLPGPLVLGDVRDLPFRDAAFDLAIAVTVLEFVDVPARAVDELARVVRRGGRIVVGALSPASPWGLAHRRRLHEPPWDRARFLPAAELRALGARHGRIALRSVLFAPGAMPGLAALGPALERAGRLASAFGAFRVLAVDRR